MRASSTTLKHSKCPHRSAGPLEQAPSTAGPSHLAYPSSAASAPIPQPQAGFKPDLNAITEAHKYAPAPMPMGRFICYLFMLTL